MHFAALLVNLSQARRDNICWGMLIGCAYQLMVILHRDIISLQWVTGKHWRPLLPDSRWNCLQALAGFTQQQEKGAIACIQGKSIVSDFPSQVCRRSRRACWASGALAKI